MLIINPDTGATHEEPLCDLGCGGFAAMPNPLCAAEHGTEEPRDTMLRICAAVGHITSRSIHCLRCDEHMEPAPAKAP